MKKIFIVLIIITLSLSKSFGQTSVLSEGKYAPKAYYLVDSLDLDAIGAEDKKLIEKSLKLFHKAKDDTSKVNALNDICKNMMHEDWEKYQRLQLAIIEKAIATNPTTQTGKALKTALSGALNNIGYIHEDKGDIPLALAYYHKSLKIQEQIKDKQGMATSYNNIGAIHDNQGDMPLALAYYHKSLKIREEIKDKAGMAISYNNIGYIHNKQGDIPLALAYFNKSLKIQEEIKDKYGMASSYNNIGAIHKKQGDIPLALAYYHKSLKIREEIKDKQGMADSYINIAYIALKQGEVGGPKGALALATKSLSISQEIGFPAKIKDASKLLSKIYEKQGNGMKALEMHKLYITMRDSILSEEATKAAVQTQAKYEYEKEKEISEISHRKELEKQTELAKEEKEKQQIITFSLLIGTLMLIIFSYFIYNRLKLTRKQKLIIQETNEELNQTNEEILAQRDQIEIQKNTIEHAHNEVKASINYAKRIQSAILPQPKLVKEFLEDSFILYKPKDIVAGDFYWLEVVGDTVLFAAADCTGHGVPGAMVSVVCNNGLNRAVREHKLTEPDQILNKTRELVVEEFEKSDEEVKDGMDISLCALDTKTNTLKWAGANNPLWILRKNEQGLVEVLETKPDKQPIGKYADPKPFSLQEIALEKGDIIYIFTDGYQDQFGGPKEKKFRAAQMKELFLSLIDKSMEEQRKIIDESFEAWKGDLEQVDDVCVIGVRI